jgi:outer membrane lipoprotein
MNRRSIRLIATAALLAWLSACTTIPEQIQGVYPDISPARVEPAVFGNTVRWGGVIIDANAGSDDTCFEVLSRDLDKYLRPRIEDRTAGRFIACKGGFHDPEVFTRGREVTLTGRIRDIEVRKVDDFDYRYPVLDVDQLVLWELREEVLVIDHHYDPFWYPYYWGSPWYGHYYPYYRRGHPMHHRTYARSRTLLPDPADYSARGPSASPAPRPSAPAPGRVGPTERRD